MADSWDSAVKDATKILGDKGKVPKQPPTISKAVAANEKSYDAFQKSREDLKAKLLAGQVSWDAIKDAVVQFQDEIDENDLGLDPKNKDDAKKIADARKVLSAALQEKIDICATNIKNLRELDRHLMSIMNYKQGS